MAYVVALFERYSLAVASLDATQRLGIGAAALSGLVLVQLLVYAAMQIPAGLLLDRLGSRRLLVCGLLLMSAAQGVFAAAHAPAAAAAARVLLGLGDSLIFISVIRLVAAWYPPRRNPVMVQITGVTGQLGSLAAAVPLLVALRAWGWEATFAAAAALALLVAVLAGLVVRDVPAGAAGPGPPVDAGPGSVLEGLRSAWSHPGTRLGLWSHFTAFFPGLTFTVLWGYPFLVAGQGVSPAVAGWLLTALTTAGILVAPALGQLVGRHPLHRSSLVLGVVAVTAGTWTVVLLWPGGRAPLPALVVLVVVMGASSPTALVGLDFARTFNPRERLGAASGLVNVGGFVATLVTVTGIGGVLQALSGVPGSGMPGSGTPGDYRWAFAVQYLVWAVGTLQIVRNRRALRRANRSTVRPA